MEIYKVEREDISVEDEKLNDIKLKEENTNLVSGELTLKILNAKKL